MLDLSKHQLVQIADKHGFQVFLLVPLNGGHVLSTILVFSPNDGIVIFGDLCPGERGVFSTKDTSLEWFAQPDLPENALCERFLKKEWNSEHAVEGLKVLMGAGTVADFGNDLLTALEDGDFYEMSADDFSQKMMAHGLEAGEIGFGYEEDESSRLLAIQRIFAAFYSKR